MREQNANGAGVRQIYEGLKLAVREAGQFS